MVYIVFGSLIAGVILLYIAQKFPSTWARVVLRTFGFVLILWLFIAYVINEFIM